MTADAAATGFAYAGRGVSAAPTPAVMTLALAGTGPAEGPTVLNATADTGMIAADDGGTWAG